MNQIEGDNMEAIKETNRLAPSGVTPSEQAESSSAHSRINIPLNLNNWKELAEDVQQSLLWFHQYTLDQGLTLAECAQALNYDNSVAFRALKGTYEGSWKNIKASIDSYRKIVTERAGIQKNEFVMNPIASMIGLGLDYAVANNSITLIIGESRMGKSVAIRHWRDRNNHGRSVLITAPAYGGTKALLREIAACLGINKNLAASATHDSILRAFNKNRILIVDEAHRLLPGDMRSIPVGLEVLRDIHDRTGCALAMVATSRFGEAMQKSSYMYEQLLGRIGLPVRLPRVIEAKDFQPILGQYIRRPSSKLLSAVAAMVNEHGRLGLLVETLKSASRIASKAKEPLGEDHFFTALKLRTQMMGEMVFAAK